MNNTICEHKRRAINNWLHSALEDMTRTVRDFIDNYGGGYIDDAIDEVYARNANSMQTVLNTNCKVCKSNPNDTTK